MSTSDPYDQVVFSTLIVNGSFSGTPTGTLGLATNPYLTITAAINAAVDTDTIHILPGTYTESNILVSHAITIEGSSETGVILAPGIVDGHLDNAYGAPVSNGFLINASGVTIQCLTIDGNANTGLSGTQNFRNAIITYSSNASIYNTFNDTVIDSVKIQNIFRKGIALVDNVGESTGNQITHSTFDHIGTDSGLSYEGTFAIAVFQSDVTIAHNTITNSAGGIGANSFDGIHFPLLTVSHNTVSSPSSALANGALGFDLASLAGGSVVYHNDIDL